MTDMSSTFGESESVTGSVILPGPNRTGNKAVVELGFSYNSVSGKLVVRLVELRQLTSASRNTSVQLRLLLLPDRKQRCKSKLRYINEDGSTVTMMETFVFSRIEPGELSSTGIRLRLYCSERLRRERLLGEAFVGLASLTLDHQREQSLLVALETKSGPFKVSLLVYYTSTNKLLLLLHLFFTCTISHGRKNSQHTSSNYFCKIFCIQPLSYSNARPPYFNFFFIFIFCLNKF